MRLCGIRIFICLILLNISFGYGQQDQQYISDTIPQIKNDTLFNSSDTIIEIIEEINKCKARMARTNFLIIFSFNYANK